VNGKGGTGKTTIASLLVAYLVSQKNGNILAIDADPNSCLAESLGVRDAETIVGICEEVSKNMDKIPSGMTKDRYIEMRVQEALTEADGFDLLAMGRPEGPGCYCYVNNLLRDIIGRLTSGYDFVVIDNAAGMEHISRRTMRETCKLVLVSDYSIPGIRSAKRIYELAKEMGIKMSGAYLVVNKVSGPLDALKGEIKSTGLKDVGDVPYDEELVKWNISNRPIFEFKGKAVWSKIKEIFNNLAGE
jgi:CO dehydrogenase maturation factor